MIIIDRESAKEQDLKRFFTNIPCVNGHISERRTNDGKCVQCRKEQASKKHLKNRDANLLKMKQRYENNKEHYKEQASIWAKNNPEKRKQIVKKYETNNPDKVKENQKKQYEKNKETVNQRSKIWAKNNPDKVKESSKKFYEQNRDRMLRYQYEYESKISTIRMRAEYRKDNKDRLYLKNKEWEKRNPEKVLAKYHNYRARKRNAEGTHTGEDIKALFTSQNGICNGCGCKLQTSGRKKYHIDHIVALANGGSNYPSNLQLLCPSCNTSKRDKDFEEWKKYKALISIV